MKLSDMKILLMPLLLVTVTLLVPASATTYDKAIGVNDNSIKQNSDSTASVCTPQLGNCNVDLNPFALTTKKVSDDKKNSDSSVPDCTSKLDVNCNTDVESSSTPDNSITKSKGADLAKIVFVDYKRPKSINNGLAGDVCGDGTAKYALLSGGIKWNSFPVTYSIDASSSGIDSKAAENAVKAAFSTIDKEDHPIGDFFVPTTSNAKITVKWANIDGTGSVLAQTTTYYNTASKTIVKADVVFDSGDKWSVNSNFGCGGGGSSFDIQDVATHELGHAIGLGHITDPLLTMYKYASPGETLKSSLGRGDQRGIDKLY